VTICEARASRARARQRKRDEPHRDRERPAYLLDLVKQQNATVADKHRSRLIALYGEERGRKVKYGEAFELCQYGRQPPAEELKKLFPTFE
jgi:hypothetical protein